MVDDGPILVTGAAGQLGSVGRTATGLLDRGFRASRHGAARGRTGGVAASRGAQLVVG